MSDKKIPVKRNALGRGLAALLDTEDNSSQKTENTGQLSGINEISLESIDRIKQGISTLSFSKVFFDSD